MGAYASSATSGMNEVVESDFAAKSRHVWMTGINVNRNQGTDVPPLADTSTKRSTKSVATVLKSEFCPSRRSIPRTVFPTLLRGFDFGVKGLLVRFAGFGVVGDAFAFDDLAEAGIGAVLPGDDGSTLALEVHDRQAGHFDPVPDLLGVGDGFALVEEGLGLADKLVREQFVVVLETEVDVGVGREPAVEQVEVGPHVLAGAAVVAVHEVVNDRLDFGLGMPQKLGDKVRTQFGEFTAAALVRRLFHDADGLVIAEELDVGLEDSEIGVGHDVMAEIDDVVPDVDVRGDGGPAVHVLDEGLVFSRAGREVVGETALDAAEADDDVVPRLEGLGRLARVAVGEGADELVGKLGLDAVGHLVDELDDRSGLAAFAVNDGLAVVALAGIAPIVLRHVVDEVLGQFAHLLPDALGDDAQDVGVRQAELGVVGGALAIEQAVILRVVLEKLLGRHERVEGVNGPVAFEAAGLFAVAHGAVDAVARSPDRLEGFVVEIVADPDAGLFGVVEPGEGVPGFLRDHGHLGRIETHTHLALEERHDTVHRAALFAAPDDDGRTDAAVGERLIFVLWRLDAGAGAEQLLSAAVPADDDHLVRFGACVFRLHRQGCPADFPEPMLQLAGSPLLGLGGVGTDHDRVRGCGLVQRGRVRPRRPAVNGRVRSCSAPSASTVLIRSMYWEKFRISTSMGSSSAEVQSAVHRTVSGAATDTASNFADCSTADMSPCDCLARMTGVPSSRETTSKRRNRSARIASDNGRKRQAKPQRLPRSSILRSSEFAPVRNATGTRLWSICRPRGPGRRVRAHR